MLDFNLEYETFFRQALADQIGKWPQRLEFTALGGSTFSQSARINSDLGTFFIKFSEQLDLEVYEREVEGLYALKYKAGAAIPQIFGTGSFDMQRYLLMEFIPTVSPKVKSWEILAEQMAGIHAISDTNFGWKHPNYIGSLPQSNTSNTNWSEFFINERLRVMVGKAFYEDNISISLVKKFDTLYPILASFFPSERSALLHGDFWSGNILHSVDKGPLWIDPSVYFGHREYDIAFSQLFGGVDEIFYRVYESLFPLEPDFEERKPIYQLYPLLVHHILFGGSYIYMVEKILDKYIK